MSALSFLYYLGYGDTKRYIPGKLSFELLCNIAFLLENAEHVSTQKLYIIM